VQNLDTNAVDLTLEIIYLPWFMHVIDPGADRA
jgi:hypothetical protein